MHNPQKKKGRCLKLDREGVGACRILERLGEVVYRVQPQQEEKSEMATWRWSCQGTATPQGLGCGTQGTLDTPLPHSLIQWVARLDARGTNLVKCSCQLQALFYHWPDQWLPLAALSCIIKKTLQIMCIVLTIGLHLVFMVGEASSHLTVT